MYYSQIKSYLSNLKIMFQGYIGTPGPRGASGPQGPPVSQ